MNFVFQNQTWSVLAGLTKVYLRMSQQPSLSLLVASSEPISLLVASSRGNLSVVKQLIENDQSLINQTNSIDSCTALHRSASNGHFYTVKYLVQKGIDINKKNKAGVYLFL